MNLEKYNFWKKEINSYEKRIVSNPNGKYYKLGNRGWTEFPCPEVFVN